MMLAAADLGIGSGHSAVADQDLARRLLGLPQSKILQYVLDFGYPADRPLKPIMKPNRRPFDEVVHRARF
jgi:nitroreductase